MNQLRDYEQSFLFDCILVADYQAPCIFKGRTNHNESCDVVTAWIDQHYDDVMFGKAQTGHTCWELLSNNELMMGEEVVPPEWHELKEHRYEMSEEKSEMHALMELHRLSEAEWDLVQMRGSGCCGYYGVAFCMTAIDRTFPHFRFTLMPNLLARQMIQAHVMANFHFYLYHPCLRSIRGWHDWQEFLDVGVPDFEKSVERIYNAKTNYLEIEPETADHWMDGDVCLPAVAVMFKCKVYLFTSGSMTYCFNGQVDGRLSAYCLDSSTIERDNKAMYFIGTGYHFDVLFPKDDADA